MTTALIDRWTVVEEAFGLPSDAIDTETGVIKNVKVLGLQSRNKARVLGLSEKEFGRAVDEPYVYTEQACREAVHLYEGASVFSNHLAFGMTADGRRYSKDETHRNEDLIGWLRNARFVPGQGIFADLHYVKSHPLSPRLVEVAQREPSKFVLSHEGHFDKARLVNGRVAIDRIVGVDAVALISSRGGTTNSLFESAAVCHGGSLFRRVDDTWMPILPAYSILTGRGIP